MQAQKRKLHLLLICSGCLLLVLFCCQMLLLIMYHSGELQANSLLFYGFQFAMLLLAGCSISLIIRRMYRPFTHAYDTYRSLPDHIQQEIDTVISIMLQSHTALYIKEPLLFLHQGMLVYPVLLKDIVWCYHAETTSWMSYSVSDLALPYTHRTTSLHVYTKDGFHGFCHDGSGGENERLLRSLCTQAVFDYDQHYQRIYQHHKEDFLYYVKEFLAEQEGAIEQD